MNGYIASACCRHSVEHYGDYNKIMVCRTCKKECYIITLPHICPHGEPSDEFCSTCLLMKTDNINNQCEKKETVLGKPIVVIGKRYTLRYKISNRLTPPYLVIYDKNVGSLKYDHRYVIVDANGKTDSFNEDAFIGAVEYVESFKNSISERG